MGKICNNDGRLILVARALRTFGYGFLGVVLALYLVRLGLDSLAIGGLLTLALFGSVSLTLAFSFLAGQWGRRRVLMVCAALMAGSGLAFGLSDNLFILIAASLTGTISATSGEVGPFLSLEQAILPQTTGAEQRTRLFAVYNLLGSLAGAVGALFSGGMAWLVSEVTASSDAMLLADRLLLILYSLLAVANIFIFARLSGGVELARDSLAETALPSSRRVPRSRRQVFLLAGLFSLDAFGGGFVVQSVVAYWFNLKFGIGLEGLGPIFFGANLLSALSFLVAERLAARIGLINTMVFTHLPSNVLLMLVALMPSAPLAVVMLFARQALSQMDVPTRQSYTMAIVAPQERLAAAAITNTSRNLTQALSPVLAGYALGVAALGLPFFMAGGLKIIYDLSLWVTFHRVKPAEEGSIVVEPK